jgi:uncharacterized repeat protein (TIGR03803 family)
MKAKGITPIPLVALALAAFTFSLAVSAQAQTESVLYTFTTPGGGEYPVAGLVFDSAGNLYGTTNAGGNSTSKGTVFKLSPTASGHWKKTELHFFGNTNDGSYPLATLTLDTSGNLYGTAVYGGNTADCRLTGPGCGIVFELSPTSSGPWKEKILYTFTGGRDGSFPVGGLLPDGAGNFYGTTNYGGNLMDCKALGVGGCGVVFRLSPTSTGTWKETVLYAFTGPDGSDPEGNLLSDSAGNLYGTTFYGGTGTGCGPYGCGTVFELSPTSSGTWTESVLYSFTGGSDGFFPNGGVAFDAAGNLYGTNGSGGSGGTVFEISPTSTLPWTEATLYTFTGGNDGDVPAGPVIFDSAGNFYGVTDQGGGSSNCGTLYKFSPSSGGWSETILHSFTCGADGGAPEGSLIFDSVGRLYGVASDANIQATSLGAVYRVNP